jgi:hypothetical protein
MKGMALVAHGLNSDVYLELCVGVDVVIYIQSKVNYWVTTNVEKACCRICSIHVNVSNIFYLFYWCKFLKSLSNIDMLNALFCSFCGR